MAQSPISLLVLKRLSLSLNPKTHCRLLQPLSRFTTKPFSTNPQQNSTASEPPSKPSSLSARLSFVFDQIDAIEKQRSEQDQTLQRIRSWRQSKQTQQENVVTQKNPETESEESARLNANSHTAELTVSTQSESGESSKEKWVVDLVHQWPEWIELVERLVQQNYFDHRRRDEDKMIQGLGIDVSDISGGSEDVEIALFKDFKTVQTACVNFGKDRFDILRSLSRHDIQILVGHGCPSTDRKVVFSGKLLRKRVHLDEGDVCSSCSLRNSCEKAFLLTNKEDEARTVDIMRILFTYGFDPSSGSVANKGLLKQKSVKTVVRKMLHEVVKLSSVPIDPNLPPPVIKKPPPKVKQPPPPPKKRVGRDDVEMKKGDWLCPKCDFMNFAKNTVCLQCDAKRPKRQLLPGEWECPECNFLNYRRNMACFHCDCKRPPDEFIENKTQEKQYGMGSRPEKVVKRPEVTDAWNFDFDDDESDGADVAAFEYADSTLMGKDPPSGSAGDLRRHEDDFAVPRGAQRFNVRDSSDRGRVNQPSIGFDDFDDEDDIDSYEIDTQKDRSVPRAPSSSSYDFSEVEGFSESENNLHARHGASSDLFINQNKHRTKKPGFADGELGFDTDDEASITPKWKSSHVASGHRNRNQGRSKKLSFGSDEEFDSDTDNDLNDRLNSGRRNNSRGGFKSKGRSFLASDSDDEDDDRYSSTNRSRGNREKPRGFTGKMKNRSNTFDDEFDGPSRGGSFAKGRGFKGDNNNQGWGRMKSRGSDSRNSFKGSNKQGGFGNRRYDNDRDKINGDYGEFRNSRRVIER